MTRRPAGRAIAYSPALDGLRAVCLTGVLLFHSPFAWLGGGFLGVSTFFTLSGYLIATLLIREAAASGDIGLRAFWDRRLRRLGPALWVGVAGVLVSAPYWLRADARQRLLPDAVSTLLYASNWRFQSPEYAYEQLFASPSPLQHSWSLSIEAQYYLVFPIVLAVCFRWGLRAGRVAGVLLVVVAVSVVAAVVDPTDSDTMNRVYYGTLPRIAEPLMGALLALALSTRRGTAIVAGWESHPRRLAMVGVVVAAVMALLWSRTSVSSAWLYRGGFAFHAVLSALLIGVIVGPDNPFAKFLAAPPLAWLGRLSYGAYVYHWPIYLVLSADRTGLAEVPLFAVRAATTVGCAWLSLRWIEQPVRERRALASLPAIATASLLLPACIAATIAWQHAAENRRLEGVRAAVSEIAEHIPAYPPAHFTSFGDSTALMLAPRLGDWMRSLGIRQRKGRCAMGCSFLHDGEIFHWRQWKTERVSCGDTLTKWKARLDAVDLDFAVVMVGPWDILTRRLGPGEPPLAFGDPPFDQAFADKLDAAMTMFRDAGTPAIWIAPPPVRFGREYWTIEERRMEASDPKRMARMRTLLHEAAERWPNTLRVVDLNAYVEQITNNDVFDPRLRPDGVHFTEATITEVIAAWLGPAILQAADELVFSANPQQPLHNNARAAKSPSPPVSVRHRDKEHSR